MKRIKDESYGVVPANKENDVWKFLLVEQISYRGKDDRFWTFPKGHSEEGESIVDTAKRELLEETSIENVQINEAAKFSIAYSFKHEDNYIDKKVTYFLGICAETEASISQPNEIADIAWCTYEEAMERLSHQNAKNVLNEVKSYIESNNL